MAPPRVFVVREKKESSTSTQKTFSNRRCFVTDVMRTGQDGDGTGEEEGPGDTARHPEVEKWRKPSESVTVPATFPER
jgi:hypothetical protein